MKVKENFVYNEDNIKILNQIPDKTFDLIFCDPPYNLQLNKDLIRPNGDKYNGVDDEWDKYDNFLSYDKECIIWIKECLRVLKDNGSFWIIGSYHNIHRIGKILQDLNTWVISEIIWNKKNPVPNFLGTRFTNAHETILWVVKNKKAKYTFNYKTMKYLNNNKQMKSVWNISSAIGKERLKTANNQKVHNTQKPESLLENIILSTSKYNDLVLDPFLGSGTTATVCKKLGRKFVGIEKENKYYQYAIKRINNTKEINNKDFEVIKKNLLDINYNKNITFKKLIDEKYIDIKKQLHIKNQIFHFQNDGTILSLDKKVKGSPNAICKELFGKPTNAWTNIYIDNAKIDLIREKYKTEKNIYPNFFKEL